MMTFIDDFLNRTTMYRLVLYVLVAIAAAAALLGFFDIVPINPAHFAFSTILILATCLATNAVFARTFSAVPNTESAYLTALILALIATPVTPNDSAGVGFLIFVSVWAMASKYLFAVGKKHLFNPAAFGAAIGALMLEGQGATWWAGGTLPLLPFVFLGGILIVRKMRRADLVWSFLATALVMVAFTASGDPWTAIEQTLTRAPIFFLAFVMLTEPLTMPPSRNLRLVYGAIVGFLFAPNLHLGSLYFTPELALLVGNLFAYLASPKGRFILTLIEKNEIADGIFEFVFKSDRPLAHRAGQYIEWTLGHRFPDDRGNRRYFTLASSPTESVVRLGVKFYEPASTFKRALRTMHPGDTISVSHPAGDFVLPADQDRKVAFIAGGIGITPFRSMVQYLADTKDARPVTLLYSNRKAAEVAYKEFFDDAARTTGMKTVYTLTDEDTSVPGFVSGKIDAALIAREIPDYRERTFYISGPHTMVGTFSDMLAGMGVSRRDIRTDYFPGFA